MRRRVYFFPSNNAEKHCNLSVLIDSVSLEVEDDALDVGLNGLILWAELLDLSEGRGHGSEVSSSPDIVIGDVTWVSSAFFQR